MSRTRPRRGRGPFGGVWRGAEAWTWAVRRRGRGRGAYFLGFRNCFFAKSCEQNAGSMAGSLLWTGKPGRGRGGVGVGASRRRGRRRGRGAARRRGRGRVTEVWAWARAWAIRDTMAGKHIAALSLKGFRPPKTPCKASGPSFTTDFRGQRPCKLVLRG